MLSTDGLWGLVNNAGWATFGEAEWVSMETYRKIMEVNVFGLIRGTQGLITDNLQLCNSYIELAVVIP